MALLLVACLTGLAACGENDDQRAAKATVAKFYGALKRHDARTACGLVSPTIADAMVRASGQTGKPCVVALDNVFQRVARSANPDRYDVLPKIGSALVTGDKATVELHRGYEKRRVGLSRVGDGWRITFSPDFGVRK